MSTQPAVVVNKKGGFFTAAVQGLFGFLIVSVVCATVLGVYWGWVIDKKADHLFNLTGALASEGAWREILPPVLSDALDDRRAPDYAEQVAIAAETLPGRDDELDVALRVVNEGDRVISVLTGRVVLVSEDGAPLAEEVVWVATPLALPRDHCEQPHHVRGPIMPGGERLLRLRDFADDVPASSAAEFELTELRIWTPPLDDDEAEAPAADAAAL